MKQLEAVQPPPAANQVSAPQEPEQAAAVHNPSNLADAHSMWLELSAHLFSSYGVASCTDAAAIENASGNRGLLFYIANAVQRWSIFMDLTPTLQR